MHSLGLILIALASITAGLTCVRWKAARIKELRSVYSMLEIMQREFDTRLTPLGELFSIIRDKDIGAASLFSVRILEQTESIGQTDFSLIWREGVESSFPALTQQERSVLQRAGEVIGKFSADRQITELKLCHDTMRSVLEAALKDYPQGSRLAIGLSLSAGAMLVIVLM